MTHSVLLVPVREVAPVVEPREVVLPAEAEPRRWLAVASLPLEPPA